MGEGPADLRNRRDVVGLKLVIRVKDRPRG
jgi:hypothetical protein